MKNPYLLSVVIPTRNRQRYAALAVQQVLATCSDEVQIVVQDNSDSTLLARELAGLSSPDRVAYAHVGGPVSFSENFRLGVARAEGQFVCVIGDDDGVLPGIEEAVRFASQLGIPAITPSLEAVYYWPGSLSGSRVSLNGCLVAGHPRNTWRVGDPRVDLDRLVSWGGLDYLRLALVKIYHGVVSKELLLRVEARAGRTFGGLSPDTYSAVALSLVTDSCLFLGWPLTIPGIAAESGSSDAASGRHVGNLEEAPHFRGTSGYEWSENVPAIYSPETIWADSCLAALRDMGETEMMNRFNTNLLSQVVADRYSGLVSSERRDIRGWTEYVSYHVSRGRDRARAKYWRIRHPPQTICNLEDILAAAARVPSYLRSSLPDASGPEFRDVRH